MPNLVFTLREMSVSQGTLTHDHSFPWHSSAVSHWVCCWKKYFVLKRHHIKLCCLQVLFKTNCVQFVLSDIKHIPVCFIIFQTFASRSVHWNDPAHAGGWCCRLHGPGPRDDRAEWTPQLWSETDPAVCGWGHHRLQRWFLGGQTMDMGHGAVLYTVMIMFLYSGTPSGSRRIFFSWVNFLYWLLFQYPFHPLLPQQHVKDPDHSAKSAGGRLQLNTHTPYVCGFAWSDMVHGCMVYTECAEMAAVSCGTSHASAVSAPLQRIFKNALYKTSHSCRITCECSESAQEHVENSAM